MIASNTMNVAGAPKQQELLPSWRMLALRGSLAVLFGILAALWPGITLLWLAVLFAAYALLMGGVSLVAAVEHRKTSEDWWLILLLGLVGLGAGAIALINTELSALILVLLMGTYALATGILDIVVAVRMRKVIEREWLLVLSGVVSIVFGVLVFLFPAAGALALVWLISAYALATGVLWLALAFRVRSHPGMGTSAKGGTPTGTLAGSAHT